MPRKKTEEKVESKSEDINIDIFAEQSGVPSSEDASEKTEEDKSDKDKLSKARKELLEKAKKMAEKIKEKKTEELKEELVESRKTLVPGDDYIKYGTYIGTKVITPHLRPFVYRRRNDGIAILDLNKTDERLKEMIKLVSKYAPQDFILICKREAGWKAVKKFSELTGVRIFTKKYPAGILTNLKLPNFFETEMVFICDPWLDKNALKDAKRIKKKVYAICDTNNYTFGIDFFVPCNNKSDKSLGLILYILAREYCKARGIKADIKLEDFVDELVQA